MRFLIVTPLVPPEPGGPSYYSVALKEALEKRGETVALRAFREVRHLPTGIRHLVFLFKVYRAARHADVLIVLDTVSVALPAVLAARIAGKPVVIRTGGDFVWERYIERTGKNTLLSEFYTTPHTLSLRERILLWFQKRIIFPRVSTLVFSTAWQRDTWMQPYALDESRTAVIENSYPKATHEAVGGDSYLCAWRPTAFKNIDTLEAAVLLAKKQDPSIKVECLKGVPRDEVHAKLRTARALVVPSLSEVSPNLAMEALAMGVPVIVTKDCGTKDRFGDRVVYIDPKDPEDIAGALVRLMEPFTYESAKKEARAFSFERTYDDVAGDYLALLTAL